MSALPLCAAHLQHCHLLSLPVGLDGDADGTRRVGSQGGSGCWDQDWVDWHPSLPSPGQIRHEEQLHWLLSFISYIQNNWD